MCAALMVGPVESWGVTGMWEQPEVRHQEWWGRGKWRVYNQPKASIFKFHTHINTLPPHTHTTVQTKENIFEG